MNRFTELEGANADMIICSLQVGPVMQLLLNEAFPCSRLGWTGEKGSDVSGSDSLMLPDPVAHEGRSLGLGLSLRNLCNQV